MLPYQSSVVFKYWRLIELLYAYQVKKNLARTGIFFQNYIYICKLLTMFDMQHLSVMIFAVLER